MNSVINHLKSGPKPNIILSKYSILFSHLSADLPRNPIALNIHTIFNTGAKHYTSNFSMSLLSRSHIHNIRLTYSRQQIPSKLNRFLASQGIPLILWDSKVHYRIHNSPLPVPTLKSIQSMPPSHFSKIHFIIILPSTPGSSKWFLSLTFLHKIRQESKLLSLYIYIYIYIYIYYRFVGCGSTARLKFKEV